MSIPHYKDGQRSATVDAIFDLPLSEVTKTSVFRFPIRNIESRLFMVGDHKESDLPRDSRVYF